MANKKIIIPVGFQFEDISAAVKEAKTKLSSIKIESGIGQQYTKTFSRLEQEIESIQKKAARGISSQSDIDSIERSLQTVIGYVEKIQSLSGKINFKDVKLTQDQLNTYNQLNRELEKAKINISQFKKEQIKNLFATDTNFSSVLKDQLNITEKSFTSQKQISDALKAQVKTLQEQTAEREKQLKQEEGLRDSLASNNVNDLVSTYGKKTANGYVFNRGMADEGRAELLAEFKKFNMDTTGLEDASLNKLMASWTSFSNQLNTSIPQAIAASNQALQELKNKQDAVKAAKESLDAAMSAGSYDELVAKVKQAEDAEEAYRQAVVQSARATVSSMATSTNAVSDGVEKQKQELISLQQQFTTAMSAENLASNLQSSLKQLVGFSAVLIQVRRGIQAAVAQIKELDSAMNGIAVVTDFTTKELWGQIDAYMAMAKQYGVTTTGVYEVSQLYYQQGLDTNDVLAMTTETLKMARIANLDYATTTNYMTTALNGFKLGVEDAGRVVDVYSKLASIAATDTAEMAKAMSNTASIAESAGMSFESTSAMLAMMIETTREAPENLGTALKTIIARFQEMKSNPTEILSLDGEEASLNKVDKALATIGISLKDASGQFRDLDEVIFELADKWDGLDRNTQRWIANTVAGSRQQSRFLALMSDSTRLHELYDAAINSEDASLVQYAKTLDSIDGKMNQLSTSFQQFYMSIMNGETIKGILDILIRFVDRLNEVGPLGATGIVASLLSAVSQVGKMIALGIVTAYKEIEIAAAQSVKNRLNNAKSAIDEEANYAVRAARNTQQQIDNIQNSSIAVRKYRRSGNNDGLPYTGGINPTAKTASFNLSTVASGLSSIAPMLSLFSTSVYTMIDQSSKLQSILNAAAQGFSTLTGAASIFTGVTTGNIGLVVSGITQIASSLTMLVGGFETTAERLSRLNKEVENANIKRAEAKQELETLESLKKQYDELSESQNDSAEAYKEWVDLNSKIIADYPMLNTYIDSEGNLIADLADEYEGLVKQKQDNYDLTLKEYELSLKRRASEPAYALEQAGVLVGETALSFFNGNTNAQLSLLAQSKDWNSYASSLSEQILSSLDYITHQRMNLDGKSIEERISDVNEVINSIVDGQTLDTLAKNGNYIQKAVVSALKNHGYNTEILQNLGNQYDTIKYGADKDLTELMNKNIYSEASKQEDKTLSNVLNSKLNSLWQEAITTGTEAGQSIVDIYDEFANNLDTNISNIINYYRDKLIENEADIAAITGSKYDLSVNAYDKLAKDVKNYLDPNDSIYFWLLQQTEENELASGFDYDTLTNFSVSNQNKIVDIEESIKRLSDGGQYQLQAYEDVINLIAESGLDQKTISSLLSNADFTSRSGITSFLDALDEALKTIGYNFDISGIRNVVENIKVSQADIDNGMTALSDALSEANKYVSKLNNLDYSDIEALVATGKFSYDEFDGNKFKGTAEKFYDTYLGLYQDELREYIKTVGADSDIAKPAVFLIDFIDTLIQNAIDETTTNKANSIKTAFKTAIDAADSEEIVLSKDVLEAIGITTDNLFFEETIGGYKYTGGSSEDFLDLLELFAYDADQTLIGILKAAIKEAKNSLKPDPSVITDMISLVGEDGIESLSKEMYKKLSEYFGDATADFNIATGKYDFNGTVKQYLDAIQEYISNTFGEEALQNFINWRAANEQNLVDTQKLAELADTKDTSYYKGLVETFRDVGGSAEEAYEIIDKLGYTINDFYAIGDGKLKLISVDELRSITTITELEKEIQELQDKIGEGTDEENTKVKAILQLRKEELATLKQKELLVASSADKDQFNDPKTFLGNIADLDTVFEDLNKKARIEYEALYNLLNNEHWAGALSHSLGLVEAAQQDGITAAEYFAKHYTDAYADIDTGKVYLNLSQDQVKAIKTGTEDSLKAIAEARVKELDAQIAMLESIKAMSNISFEGDAEINEIISTNFKTSDGKEIKDLTELRDYLENNLSAEQWIELTKDIKIDPTIDPVGFWSAVILKLTENSGQYGFLPLSADAIINIQNALLNKDSLTGTDKELQQQLDELKKKGKIGTVDLTYEGRPHIVVDNDNLSQVQAYDPSAQLGETVTHLSTVISADEDNNVTIACTPVLPDGSGLLSPEDLDNYISGLIDEAGGSIDLMLQYDADTKNGGLGLIEAVFSGNQALQDAIDFTQKLHEVVQAQMEANPVSIQGDATPLESTAKDAADKVSAIKPKITIFAQAASSLWGTISNIIGAIPKTITTTIKAKTEKSGNSGGFLQGIFKNLKGGTQSTDSDSGAYGGVFSGGKTLVGELGPELRVSNGKYSIVGANGAEFINLKKNDIIFSTEQTAGLFKGRSGIRGTAMAYGNAFAGGTSNIDAAITALQNERNLWQAILTRVPEMLKKAGSGSGGGGGGSSSESEYLMELERWFNWLRQIEQLENKITILRAKRENMKSGKVYAESLYEENALLKKQYDITKDLLENQIKYKDSLKTKYLEEYGKYFYFIGDALQINAQAILDDTKNNEELGEAIQNMIDEYDDITQQITDNTTALEENNQQIEENIRTLRDKYIEMENQVLSALQASYEKQIELKQKELDSRIEADEEYLSALQKNLDKEKDMRKKAQTAEEKTQLQRKIALLERDTSGRNAKEIASLREQLRQMQEDEYYTGREDAITAAENAAKAEQDILQNQIDIMEAINQTKLDNMELYWAEVENIISQGADNILSFLASYSDEYLDVSKIQQEDYLTSWKFTIDAALTYAQDMQKQFDEVIYKAQEAAKYGNTSATGGLDVAKPSGSNGGGGSSSSSGSGSSGNKNSSSSSSKTPMTDEVDVVSGAAPSAHGWYYQINLNGKSTGIRGGPYKTREDAQSNGASVARSKGYGYKYSTKYYLNGGLADYTGYAWVDGTKARPEAFLDADDTKLLANFIDYAKKSEPIPATTINSAKSNIQSGNNVNINSVDITIESGVIEDKADAEMVGTTIAEQLMKIARKSGNISVSRR